VQRRKLLLLLLLLLLLRCVIFAPASRSATGCLRGELDAVRAAAHGRVPAVLDGVFGAAREKVRDLAPAVAEARLLALEDGVLLGRPGRLVDVRVQVVEVALAALLADAPRDAVRDLAPLADSLLEALHDRLVLLKRPGALHEPGAQHFLPAVQALHVRALAAEVLGDAPPVLGLQW
jgi:hypothetical protein